jgi:hypothetical protein
MTASKLRCVTRRKFSSRIEIARALSFSRELNHAGLLLAVTSGIVDRGPECRGG